MVSLQALNLAEVLQGIPDGVIVFAPDRQVLFANAAASRLTGLPQRGFYLADLARLLQTRVSVNLEDAIEAVLREGAPVHLRDVQVVSFFYEFFITACCDADQKIVGGIIVMHDVTDRVELDRAKSEFVSLASHQLRTPLSTVSWYAEMLLAGDAGKLREEQRRYVDEIYTSNHRMIALVNDLLNSARLESGRLTIEPVPTQLEDFIKSINGEMTELARQRNCAITFKAPKKKLPKISIDQTLLRQVVSNLLSNAIRYSPKDKKCEVVVTIEIKQFPPLPEGRLGGVGAPPLAPPRKGGEIGEHMVVISVKDQGIGIPKDVQPKIFTKFFRADNARLAEGEGSGLGLSIAKMIMEASGGKIWFESPAFVEKTSAGKEEGKGTTFFISIPMTGMKTREGEKGLAV